MSADSARRGQIALGLLWLADGLLQCQPFMFSRSFVNAVLLPSAAGQPRVIGAPIVWAAHVIEPRIAVFNGFAAALEILLGIGLLHRSTVKPALVISIVWALAVWSGGEGFGLLFTGTANPATGAPGAALLYVPVALICRPSGPRGGLRLARVRPLWSIFWLANAALWLLAAHASPATAGLAVVSAAIGLAVLRGWWARGVIAAQILLSALYWVLGQRFGGVFTGQATDVGTAPLVILIALLVGRPPPAQARLGATDGRGTDGRGADGRGADGWAGGSATSSRAHSAATTSGSNCVPAQRRNSASASGRERAA
jgi:hypothetical protein